VSGFEDVEDFVEVTDGLEEELAVPVDEEDWSLESVLWRCA
jgi:hypothetical protein